MNRLIFATAFVDLFGVILDEAQCVSEVAELIGAEKVDELGDCNSIFQVEHFVCLKKLLTVVFQCSAAV